MDYQPGQDPGMAGIPYDSPASPLPQPYDHSRAGMVILTILSLAKVVIPNLGAYCSLATGLLYLTFSAPFLHWALVTCYLDGLSSPSISWYMTVTGHDMTHTTNNSHLLNKDKEASVIGLMGLMSALVTNHNLVSEKGINQQATTRNNALEQKVYTTLLKNLANEHLPCTCAILPPLNLVVLPAQISIF
ncbi:hypothetical protein DSO57_1032258 [Entomophthora muscae]|uniref:Uncharacterized protein n=1 Tax=Entomophthora muscae TaxID=34485 RepID=A0ACC2TMH7_9FUNG|nr:hypothetical protein DSO57_1032258 [Entomophthora muscae]